MSHDHDGENRWRFWRDDAKLSILCPETRARTLVLFGGSTLVCVVLLIWPGIGAHIGMEELIVRFASLVVLLLVFPSLLAIEMFYKGGNAGQEMKAAIHGLQNPKTRPATIHDVSERFAKLAYDGQQMQTDVNSPNDYQEWRQQAEAEIVRCLRPTYSDVLLAEIARIGRQPNNDEGIRARQFVSRTATRLSALANDKKLDQQINPDLRWPIQS